MDALAENLGAGLEALALIVTLAAICATLLAWSLLLYFGRSRSGLRGAGLALVIAVHWLPLPALLFDTDPADSWSLTSLWHSWGAGVAWSVPGIVALVWLAPELVRASAALRAVAVVSYATLIATIVYRHQPRALPLPLVEIVTTPREQWACGLTASGDVYCLGGNHEGQLEPGGAIELERPRRIAALSPSRGVFMGRFMTCSLVAPASARCIGRWHGNAGRTLDATSSLEPVSVLVGDSVLAFVSAEGAVEAWSERGARRIAETSSKQVLCGASIALLVAGRAELRQLDSGRRSELGPARDIGCAGLSGEHRVVLLEAEQLRYFTASGEHDEDVAVPAGVSFTPWDEYVELVDGDRAARCAAGAALFGRVAVSCDWHASARRPVLLRGAPDEIRDPQRTYAAQTLASLSLSVR